MKKLLFLFFSTIIFWQCQIIPQKHYNSIEGTYKVNIDSALNYLKQNDEYKFLINQFAGLLSNIKILIIFNKNNSGQIETNTNYLSIIQSIIDSSIDNSKPFFYKIVQDTLLMIKWEQDENFRKWAYIYKDTEDYKQIKLVLLHNNLPIFLQRK